MAKIKIVCDRCKSEVEGLLTPQFTAGFYNVAKPFPEANYPGGAWAKFGKEEEDYICDHCMWSDPAYQTEYQHDGVMQQWLAGSE